MKTILIFNVLFFASFQIYAQCNFDQLIKEGKSAAKREDFELALNKFNSARRCDPAKGDEVDKAVDVVFRAIKKQRNDARAARDSVTILLKKFEAASAEIVEALVREANNLIYHLDYNAAVIKLRIAANLNQPTTSFKRTLAEVIFFWNEAGQSSQLADLLAITKQTNVPQDRYLLDTWLKNYVGIWYDTIQQRYFPNMLFVSGGTDTIEVLNSINEKTLNVITLSSFKLAMTETTWWQYNLFCEATNREKPEKPIGWGGEGDNPVIAVNWYDAVAYANWLTLHEDGDTAIVAVGQTYELRRLSGAYRLPTDSEWRYAARAGQKLRYSGVNIGEQLDEFAWYSKNSGRRTHLVGGKKPNAWELYDMSGNVWEWCWDWFSAYASDNQMNPTGAESGIRRIIHGGSWDNPSLHCRPEYCVGVVPDDHSYVLGFRIALQL